MSAYRADTVLLLLLSMLFDEMDGLACKVKIYSKHGTATNLKLQMYESMVIVDTKGERNVCIEWKERPMLWSFCWQGSVILK